MSEELNRCTAKEQPGEQNAAPQVDYLKLARRIWRDLRHALNDISVGRSEQLPEQKGRFVEFAKYLGDTSDYRQNLPAVAAPDAAAMVKRLHEPRQGIHENGEEEMKTWEQLWEQCQDAAAFIEKLGQG